MRGAIAALVVAAIGLFATGCLGGGGASAGRPPPPRSVLVSRRLELGAGASSGRFRVHYPFAGATVELRARAPLGTRFRVHVHDGVGRGASFPGMRLRAARDCRAAAAALLCARSPFEAFEPGAVRRTWTVWLLKRSPPPAAIWIGVVFRR